VIILASGNAGGIDRLLILENALTPSVRKNAQALFRCSPGRAAAGQWVFTERGSKLKRLQTLVAALLPNRRDGQAPLSEVRYQLLTAVAGAWAFAAQNAAPVAVFVVHEFLTTEADLPAVRENERDLNQALARLTRNRVTSLKSGDLV